MFGWLKGKPSPRLAYPSHYGKSRKAAPGASRRLKLQETRPGARGLDLRYRWAEDLPWEEADRLDTRTRAYVACAIYDAAEEVDVWCEPGPPHGQRPSWVIGREPAPWSLIAAEFDAAERECRLRLGPIYGPGGGAGILARALGMEASPGASAEAAGGSGTSGVAAKLAEGFASRFTEIEV